MQLKIKIYTKTMILEKKREKTEKANSGIKIRGIIHFSRPMFSNQGSRKKNFLLPLEFLPVSRLLTQWCASLLGTALLWSSRAGSCFGAHIQAWVEGFINWVPLPKGFFVIHFIVFSIIYFNKLDLTEIMCQYYFWSSTNLTKWS